MPQVIKVKSLYSITLTHVNSTLCSLAKQGECSPTLVSWIKSNLHRNIKEDLLAQYNWWHKPYSLCYMNFVIDCTVNKIVLNECLSNRSLTGLDYIEFMEYLYGQNIEHLCNLSLHFKKYLIETSKLKQGNYFLCLSLNNGMARNLHTVVLPYVADNSVLKCLGEHCTQLVYLDISNSWNIDEDGIFNLLFKNPEELNLPVDVISSEMDPPSECLLDELSVSDEELNPACFTLQEIRIQDTNTSPTNLFIILLAVKNLKSLGGYLYFRSVGDAIVTLNSNNPALRLNLTHLWDAHLPPLKLDTLALVLPHLSTLSTRVSNLPFKRSSVERFINTCLRSPSVNPGPQSPSPELPEDQVPFTDPCQEHRWPFRNITHLTLDFDFLYSDHLFRKFLKYNGHSLRKLVLVDQPYNFNLLCIDQHCPLLEELTACVMVPEETRVLPPMKNLRSAELTINADKTLLSIFVMFPSVQQLTVHIRPPSNLHENQNGVYDMFFQDITSLQLPCFQSLLELRLHFESDSPPNHGYPGLGVEEAAKLLELFENLRSFGNVDSWGDRMKFKELETYVRAKRWDVELKRNPDSSEESTVYNR